MNYQNFVPLTEQSEDNITELCELILKKYPNNMMSTSIATTIMNGMPTYHQITLPQAVWLARNFDYQRTERPTELKDIVVPAKKKPLAAPPAALADDETDKLIEQLTSCLQKLERRLDAHH